MGGKKPCLAMDCWFGVSVICARILIICFLMLFYVFKIVHKKCLLKMKDEKIETLEMSPPSLS